MHLENHRKTSHRIPNETALFVLYIVPAILAIIAFFTPPKYRYIPFSLYFAVLPYVAIKKLWQCFGIGLLILFLVYAALFLLVPYMTK